MPLILRSNETEQYPLIPPDNYPARCFSVVDIGTQHSPFYGPKRQLIVSWELPTYQQVYDQAVGSEPAAVSKFYSASIHEKSNLGKDLVSWRGRAFTEAEAAGFDVMTIIGAPCLLQIVHKQTANGETKAIVGNVTKLPAGLDCAAAINPVRRFLLDESTADDFSKLPSWQSDIVQKADEYHEFVQRIGAAPQQQQQASNDDDDVPF